MESLWNFLLYFFLGSTPLIPFLVGEWCWFCRRQTEVSHFHPTPSPPPLLPPLWFKIWAFQEGFCSRNSLLPQFILLLGTYAQLSLCSISYPSSTFFLLSKALLTILNCGSLLSHSLCLCELIHFKMTLKEAGKSTFSSPHAQSLYFSL